MNPLDVYKGKSVLITGNTGFCGSWLSIWLKKLGAKVSGYSLHPPTQPNMFEALKLENEIPTVFGDIRDENILALTLDYVKPEFVFHLAAQPIVKDSYRKPKETFETNTMGTLNVLEAIRETPSVKVAVMITTDKVYEDKYPYVYSENNQLGGNDPYSASKACAEHVIATYRHSYLSTNVMVASARAGNIIGGGDWAERIVPISIKSIVAGEKIPIYAPNSTRPWQHVLEPLYGYLLLGAKMYQGFELDEAWNFGPELESCITVENLVKKIIKYWGSGEYTITNPDKTMPESMYLRLNCNKAKKLLGWKPKYSVDEAVKETVSWYKEYYHGYNDYHRLYDFTVKQIEKYEEYK